MDICASWLKMTVNGNISTVERFPMIVATIFNASDMCLAAVISRFQPFVDVLYAFLLIRVFVNVRRLIALSMTIVRREDKQKTTS